MIGKKLLSVVLVLALTLVWTEKLFAQGAEVIFKPIKIDGPIHDPANHTYWFGPFCETASVLDVDGDGDLDIAAGRNWYEAPLWIKHTDFRDGAETNGPETESNSEFAMDVNFDGQTDVVASGWMVMKGAFWYENPGNKEAVWPSKRIHTAYNMEGIIHADIDGDGDEDILCNHWGPYEGQGMTWIEHIDRAPWFVEHVVGTDGEIHGNGTGDINMDGRVDIVTPIGWYEQPARATDTPWTFHEDFRFKSAKGRGSAAASHPLLVHDVNEDGLNDIIIGSAHEYGLVWLEQHVDASGNRTFEEHWIETEFSVFHTMALGDVNGDGKDDLVTGKRLLAHYGNDIGAFDPMFAFWYDIQGGKFERHILAFNHLPYFPDEGGLNPPPNMVVGVGMKINIKDMDHDGDNDILLAGKGGLYLFENTGFPPTPRQALALPPDDSYPTWREWGRYRTLFNTKDFAGWKVPEGDNGHWKVIDGIIDYDAQSEAEGDKSLYTEESFDNFRLHVEWRIKRTHGEYPMPTILPDGTYRKDASGNDIITPTPNADSGIYLRGDVLGQINIWNWPVGSGELWGVRTNENNPAEVRAAAVPKMKADRPIGEWNSFDITMIGDRVTVMLNGKVVIENAQIPGIPASGPIALQHHGGIDTETGELSSASSLMQFQNIWIDRLGPDADPVLLHPGRLADEEEGWVTLFNGEDLDGWQTGPDNAWVVKDGALTIDREMDGREHNQDYLWTEEPYGDFMLDLEFKVEEGSNSGVFIRTSDIQDPVYTGFEVQVSGIYGWLYGVSKNLTPGALYDAITPTRNAVRPLGEWNKMRVTFEKSVIDVELNGEHIVHGDLARWTTPNQNPDGSPNKFGRALAEFARSGYIGLQDHGRPVWYRNIRIKRLDEE